MVQNNIEITAEQSIRKAFDELETEEQILNFFKSYFGYFIKAIAQPANYSFKDTIDAVSKLYQSPVSNLLARKKHISSEEQEKISLWQACIKKFENTVVDEMKRFY